MPGLYYVLEIRNGKNYRKLSPHPFVSPLGTEQFFSVEENLGEDVWMENFFLYVVAYQDRTSTWDFKPAGEHFFMVLGPGPGKGWEIPTISRSESDALGKYLERHGWEAY